MPRAAILKKYDEPFEIEHRDHLEPPADGVVIETDSCGICRSDWHSWKGHWPGHPPEGHVLGHEPAGTVTAVGEEVERFDIGDEVGVPFSIACGHCSHCWDGQSQVCSNRLSVGLGAELPGAFASEFAIPRADFNALHLPDGMNSVEMAALGCRFATSFHAFAHKADLEAGDWVAIHGCGGIGLSAVHIANALGANVVAVDLNDETLSVAESVGALETINGAEVDDVPKAIRGYTDGGADISMDALGIPETCKNSLACLDVQGQHVQVGMSTTDEEDDGVPLPLNEIVGSEIEFIGSKGMPTQRYPELLRMITSGKLQPTKLVTQKVTLEEVSDRLRAMDDYGTVGIEVVTEF